MDVELVKSNIDLLQLASCDTPLKKVSSSGGGEWAGPCPMCGGKDRFRIQPNRPGGGKWYCRGCGEGHWHDAFDYIARRDGLDFQAALSSLAGKKH
jgi:DNA primase